MESEDFRKKATTIRESLLKVYTTEVMSWIFDLFLKWLYKKPHCDLKSGELSVSKEWLKT
jgi:hypothetical protein